MILCKTNIIDDAIALGWSEVDNSGINDLDINDVGINGAKISARTDNTAINT